MTYGYVPAQGIAVARDVAWLHVARPKADMHTCEPSTTVRPCSAIWGQCAVGMPGPRSFCTLPGVGPLGRSFQSSNEAGEELRGEAKVEGGSGAEVAAPPLPQVLAWLQAVGSHWGVRAERLEQLLLPLAIQARCMARGGAHRVVGSVARVAVVGVDEQASGLSAQGASSPQPAGSQDQLALVPGQGGKEGTDRGPGLASWQLLGCGHLPRRQPSPQPQLRHLPHTGHPCHAAQGKGAGPQAPACCWAPGLSQAACWSCAGPWPAGRRPARGPRPPGCAACPGCWPPGSSCCEGVDLRGRPGLRGAGNPGGARARGIQAGVFACKLWPKDCHDEGLQLVGLDVVELVCALVPAAAGRRGMRWMAAGGGCLLASASCDTLPLVGWWLTKVTSLGTVTWPQSFSTVPTPLSIRLATWRACVLKVKIRQDGGARGGASAHT
ncbi:hypothetical protein HaLaN_06387 [Haematococcus lacustris]|uniref:Uncharacterized protein n=1 Tax=Haematococcus lacustris TaxID=44745 RepID=A0A699YLJ3_HAELA|nr:hypothetical protein HaLaN_06387 [Haematococcus lacustris]